MELYIQRFRFDTSNEVEAINWAQMCNTLKKWGLHLTELPANSKRPDRISYDLHQMGYCWITPDGEEMYDFVVYRGDRIKAGYYVIPWDSELNGGCRLVNPLPPRPVTAAPDTSRTAKAVEWLQEDLTRTQADAAELFGITPQCVSAAASTAPKGKSASRQAVEWLRANPEHRTQADAAELFGIERATVAQAVARFKGREV